MKGFITTINQEDKPVSLYIEQLSPLSDTDGYLPYLVRGDCITARIHVYAEYFRLPHFQIAGDVETTHYNHQVLAYTHDQSLNANDVLAIGEAIGEHVRLVSYREARLS